MASAINTLFVMANAIVIPIKLQRVLVFCQSVPCHLAIFRDRRHMVNIRSTLKEEPAHIRLLGCILGIGQ